MPQPLAAADEKPGFSYIDEKGAIVSPDLSKHKLTAVHFWATWCVPCVAELPEVDATQANYASQGLHIITISMDEKPDKVQKFYNSHKIMNLPPYLDNKMSSFRFFRLRGLPSTIFLNAKGEEVGRAIGPMPWMSVENISFLQENLK